MTVDLAACPAGGFLAAGVVLRTWWMSWRTMSKMTRTLSDQKEIPNVAVPDALFKTIAMTNKDPPVSPEEKARYDKVKDELTKMLMKKRAADRQLVRLAIHPHSTKP